MQRHPIYRHDRIGFRQHDGQLVFIHFQPRYTRAEKAMMLAFACLCAFALGLSLPIWGLV